MAGDGHGGRGLKVGGALLGSLRDALAAAGRDDPNQATRMPPEETMKDITNALAPPEASPVEGETPPTDPPPLPTEAVKTAAEAVRDARGGTPNVPVVDIDDVEEPMTTGVIRDVVSPPESDRDGETTARTQFVRGKQTLSRTDFAQDPVVGWLVVVGGPGLGAFRPIFEGNNTIGRSSSNRIPIDFGDESISNSEQAYLRYDSTDRSFLLVPNLTKTNVVSVNNDRPAQPVRLTAMDLITMGRTQLVFVPFCGSEFDWGELSELNR